MRPDSFEDDRISAAARPCQYGSYEATARLIRKVSVVSLTTPDPLTRARAADIKHVLGVSAA